MLNHANTHATGIILLISDPYPNTTGNLAIKTGWHGDVVETPVPGNIQHQTPCGPRQSDLVGVVLAYCRDVGQGDL